MLRKKERTIDVYKRAGAIMRLYKTLGAKLLTEISMVLPAGDQNKIMKAMRKIDEACSNAECNMFLDHPQLSDKYIDVFYGSTEMKPKNDVDAEIIDIAKEIANGLFK